MKKSMSSMTYRILRFAAPVVSLALASCGGGGNESGPPTTLLAAPAMLVVTGPLGRCATGVGPTVFIYGGQPPYRLSNSAPRAMTRDKTVLANSGDGFVVTFSGGCLDQIPINVEDDMGRVLSVPISNVVGTT